MNWLNKMERKYGSYAIPNVSRYLVLAVVIGILIQILSPALMGYLQFQPAAILRGQVWRLFTWIFVPATSIDFFGLIFLYCVFSWGSSLESMIGSFRMNYFMLQGIILTDIGGLAIFGLSFLTGDAAFVTTLSQVSFFSMYYILLSMLMALAICVPEGEVRLYFVLPIKMKWMLVFELLYLAYQVFTVFKYALSVLSGLKGLLLGLVLSSSAIFAVISMFLFFWLAQVHPNRAQRKRQREFRTQFSQPRPGSGITTHKCAICGRTEQSNPELTFRYCSKCKGNMEYCQEHLFTHRHVI